MLCDVLSATAKSCFYLIVANTVMITVNVIEVFVYIFNPLLTNIIKPLHYIYSTVPLKMLRKPLLQGLDISLRFIPRYPL
jgi:hypothetical protein